jgi:CRISPR/Cas system-associated exonuclease Cas4 (RecB family)
MIPNAQLEVDRKMMRSISVSKVDDGMLCMLHLKYRYIDRVPELSGGTMMAGNVFHEIMEHALNQVILGRSLPDWKTLDDMFEPTWSRLSSEMENGENFIGWDWRDESEEKVKAEYRPLIKLAREAVLPTLKPKFVEHRFDMELEGESGPIPFVGYIDLVEEDGLLSDWKTVEKVSDRQKKMGIQFMGYSTYLVSITGQAVTLARKIFLVRGRRPRVEMANFRVEQRHRDWFLFAAEQVWKGVQARAFPPNTNTWMCSANWCSFHASCQGGLL